MAKIKFKYNLNHLISLSPRWLSIEDITAELEKEGIPKTTFYNDRAIKSNDTSDIPGNRLMIYAKLFEVDITKLFNYDRKVKPLSERRPSKHMQKIIERTGLTS